MDLAHNAWFLSTGYCGHIQGVDDVSVAKFWKPRGPVRRRKNAPHSTEQFSVVLDQERARVDRTGREFSLVVFEGRDPRRARVLQKILGGRLRASDQVGWMDDQRIGVILTDTPVEGAWKFADDVRRSATADGPPLACSVCSYPSPWLPGDDGHGEGR